MASGLGGTDPDGAVTHCPLCQTPVASSDELQLHYLTSCSGYDKVSNEQPRSKLTNPPAADDDNISPGYSYMSSPRANSQSGTSATASVVTSQAEATATTVTVTNAPEDSSEKDDSLVQFMWQPLTEITYPSVTLLASFKPGSVELKIDRDGGHYASKMVVIPKGIFEGQLVIGDSFMHPVKPFTIQKENDIIILQFEVQTGDTGDLGVGVGGSSSYSSSHYGTGYMQKNPSYGGHDPPSVSYSNPAFDQGTGTRQTYNAGYGGDSSRYSGSGTTAGNDFHYYQNYGHEGSRDLDPASQDSRRFARPAMAQDTATSRSYDLTADSYTQPPESIVKSKNTGSGNVAAPSNEPSNSHLVTGAHNPTSPTSTDSKQTSNPPTHFAADIGSVSINIKKTGRSDASRPRMTDTSSRSTNIAASAASSGTAAASGFNVQQIKQDDELANVELRQQLEAMTKERDRLQQSQERVNAQWQGRVKRLEMQLQQARGDEAPPEDDNLVTELNTAHGTIANLERQVTTLQAQNEQIHTSSVSTRDLEKEVSELKDRNTALQHQLIEYSETIQEQAKLIRGNLAGSKASSVEALQYQQEKIHMLEFAKKQQLEYEETLSKMGKEIATCQTLIEENKNLRHQNTNLAGELEDYRTQTKRLIADLQQKDEELSSMRQALSRRGGGNDAAELELATMREKCEAWREEVESLVSLRDDVEHYRSEITRLEYEKAELGRQIESMVEENERKRLEPQQNAAVDYDTLMERYTQLQQTRLTLENELQPLREERAAMLRENAALREGSNPQNYEKLRLDYQALAKHCEYLEELLQQEKSLVVQHKDSNLEMQQQLDKATDPSRIQSIRERMERYKQERDTARQQAEELESKLALFQVEHQTATDMLNSATETSEQRIEVIQQQLAEQQQSMDHVLAKCQDYETRMRRYREERNKAQQTNKALLIQIKVLQDTQEELLAQNRGEASLLPSMLSSNFETMVIGREDSSSPAHQYHQPTSPSPEYVPQNYSTDQVMDEQQYMEGVESPVGKPERSLSSLSAEHKRHRSSRSSSESHGSRERTKSKTSDQSLFTLTQVKTKEGYVNMYVQKPHTIPNPKHKPRVIVKRGDDYEMGTLMYVGSVNGKDLAGIQMDIRLPKISGSPDANDGTHNKDGRRYFKCANGLGYYVPLSRVYVEMQSATV